MLVVHHTAFFQGSHPASARGVVERLGAFSYNFLDFGVAFVIQLMVELAVSLVVIEHVGEWHGTRDLQGEFDPAHDDVYVVLCFVIAER